MPSFRISENFMDSRPKFSSLYAHFVFYPYGISEGRAVEQCEYAREKLQAVFAEINIDYVIGALLFQCYTQCGYKNDDVRCVLAVSPNNQTGRFRARKCYILPEPRDCFTTNNHVHLLVNGRSTIAALDVDSKQATSIKKVEKMEAALLKKKVQNDKAGGRGWQRRGKSWTE